MDMLNSAIEVKVTPPVGTLLLNRPDRRNALSTAMACALRQAISDLHQEQRVRAIVITGAGNTFCAGRDLIEMATDTDEPSASPPLEKWGEQESECCDLIVELLSIPKPVIAAVNGPVIGLGVALTLASDIVIASASAQLGLPETRYGLVAGIVAPLLAYRVGAGPAARLLMTGDMIPAEEVHRLGLYHELVDH
ncbi:MAG: enoyl-CoA hydratase/isomerase family protein, partial [Aeoliella sp.]